VNVCIVFNLKVLNSDGKIVESQLEPNEDNEELFTILFPVEIPALGFATYFLQVSGRKFPGKF
jgi:hypothetical protein